MSYFDCYMIPLPAENLAAYRAFSARIAAVYQEYGAIRIVDCLIDTEASNSDAFHAEGARDVLANVPLPSFERAADLQPAEVLVLSWTEWPDKAARDAGLAKALADPRVQPEAGEAVLFEGRRLIAGGFHALVDTAVKRGIADL